MVYNELIDSGLSGSIDKLTGEEEIYVAVGRKGWKVMDFSSKKRVAISGRYVLLCCTIKQSEKVTIQ